MKREVLRELDSSTRGRAWIITEVEYDGNGYRRGDMYLTPVNASLTYFDFENCHCRCIPREQFSWRNFKYTGRV